jgi:hypothetical protein
MHGYVRISGHIFAHNGTYPARIWHVKLHSRFLPVCSRLPNPVPASARRFLRVIMPLSFTASAAARFGATPGDPAKLKAAAAVCTYMYVYVHICICMCMYIYVCVCVQMHIYVHTFTGIYWYVHIYTSMSRFIIISDVCTTTYSKWTRHVQVLVCSNTYHPRYCLDWDSTRNPATA